MLSFHFSTLKLTLSPQPFTWTSICWAVEYFLLNSSRSLTLFFIYSCWNSISPFSVKVHKTEANPGLKRASGGYYRVMLPSTKKEDEDQISFDIYKRSVSQLRNFSSSGETGAPNLNSKWGRKFFLFDNAFVCLSKFRVTYQTLCQQSF